MIAGMTVAIGVGMTMVVGIAMAGVVTMGITGRMMTIETDPAP